MGGLFSKQGVVKNSKNKDRNLADSYMSFFLSLHKDETFLSMIYQKIKSGEDFSEEFIKQVGETQHFLTSKNMNAYKALLNKKVHKADITFTEEESQYLHLLALCKENKILEEDKTYQELIKGYKNYLISIGEFVNFDETQAAEDLTT